MHLGVMAVQTETSMPPDRLAIAAEERGFDSVWFSDHTHVPVDSTPYPMGGDIPLPLKQLYDPLICLAAAASVTTRIALGTGVILLAQRDPIITAKEISTIDHISGGRTKVGIGFGWNRREAAAHGVDPAQRWDIVRDKALAMKQLWTQEVASYTGNHVHLEPSWQWPKPLQRPHPPIYLGGAATPNTLGRVVDYCDGWIPLGTTGLGSAITELHTLAEQRGRQPASIDIIPVLADAQPEDRHLFDEITELGLTKVIVGLPPAAESELLEVLDRFARHIDS